jgi:hypothetical protein
MVILQLLREAQRGERVHSSNRQKESTSKGN